MVEKERILSIKLSEYELDINGLETALEKKFESKVMLLAYDTSKLHGGTLGDVYLVEGTLELESHHKKDFKIVHKRQKKWERYFDPSSWRREYDLYTSDLSSYFSEQFRWPLCYHATQADDEIQLWLEYIAGETAVDLTVEMYEAAAYELGSFQGKLYVRDTDILQEYSNLSNIEFLKNNYLHYRSWPEVYDYVRLENCPLPKHLCDMMIELDRNEELIWSKIQNLPQVLCHRDFWTTNIFYDKGQIRVIDWDTTGVGFFGEDMASLIADETPLELMVECYQKCIPAYYNGFTKYVDLSEDIDDCVYELILLMFGYRLIEGYKFSENEVNQKLCQDTLEEIYKMKKLSKKDSYELQIQLRRETPEDYRMVEELTKKAFWNLHEPGCNEHYLIHELRGSDAFIYDLDYVAVVEDKIVGHIAYTESQIVSEDGDDVTVLTFGPISVLPQYQRQGIGRRLIEHTRSIAKDLGYKAIIIYGDPMIYSRVGFRPAEEFKISTPDKAYVAALQACELYEDALTGVSGQFHEDVIFHVDAEEAEKFDKSFPQIEKLEGLASQERFLEVTKMSKPVE